MSQCYNRGCYSYLLARTQARMGNNIDAIQQKCINVAHNMLWIGEGEVNRVSFSYMVIQV